MSTEEKKMEKTEILSDGIQQRKTSTQEDDKSRKKNQFQTIIKSASSFIKQIDYFLMRQVRSQSWNSMSEYVPIKPVIENHHHD